MPYRHSNTFRKKYYLLQDLPQQKIIVRGLTSCLSIASM
jgi:hypothetical protein